MVNSRFTCLLLHALLLAPAGLYAQSGSPTCVTTAVAPVVRAEGITERVGDIVLTCTGTPNQEVTGNLTVFLSVAVTNRVLSDSGALDVGLSVNGAVANVSGTLGAPTQVTFAGLRIPFNSAGAAELRLSNVRVNATAALSGGSFFPQPIVAQIGFNPSVVSVTQSTFQVAIPQRGLYATGTTPVVPSHAGSFLPEDINFAELIRKQTIFFSTRVTEGFQTAFEPPQAGSAQGTRIMLRFSGFTSDTRLFVPNNIAGYSAQIPTSAGDFGRGISGGSYVPGSGTLLLSRVSFTDANGSGGAAMALEQPPSGGMLNGVSEVTLSGGSGVAVYEVRDADPRTVESAQIPVFIGVPRSESSRSVNAQVNVTFAPTSTVFAASRADAVPRFAAVAAPTDCGVFRDCNSYIPKLNAPPVNMDFRLVRGVGTEYRVIPLGNDGGGLMPWAASIEYKRGSGWILLDRESALEPVSVRVVVRALTEMQAGIYEATIVIDAGAAGVARYPVRLEVVEPQTPPPPVVNLPTVTEVVHGATFAAGPVARGALVTLRGTNLNGNNVSVTFDGRLARILFSNSEQINLQVPADLPGNTAQVVVTVNGTASAAKTVNVTAAAPGIFTPGILNQDSSVNSPTNPANAGSFVQIYATGLLAADGSGIVDAKLHDLVLTTLPYAGPAPGLPGVQQVNLQIPQYFPTMTTEVLLCTSAGGQRQCSAPVKIHVRQVQ